VRAILLTLALLACARVAPAEEPLAGKRVLVLYSQEKELPGYVAFDRAFRAALGEPLVDVYSETLDDGRFEVAGARELARETLRRKYAGKTIDLVVAVRAPALDFLLRERAALFGAAPVVFCKLAPGEVERRDLGPDVTGLTERPPYARTAALALALEPGTQRVVLVGGASALDRYEVAAAEEALRPLAGRVEVETLAGPPLEDVIARCARLPERAVILYTCFLEDGSGRSFTGRDVAAALARAASAPVFVGSALALGLGALGGCVHDWEAEGAASAERALRVLRGARPLDIPVAECSCDAETVDWRQLARWRIPEERVPAGTVVLFREAGFWERHRDAVAGAIALVPLETILILWLLLERGRRRRALAALGESEARYRTILEEQSDLICRYRPDGTLTFVNDAYCRAKGTAREALLGSSVWMQIPEAHHEACRRKLAKAVATRAPVTDEHRVPGPGGEARWQEWTCSAIFDARGEVSEYQSVGSDVTERKRAEEALREGEARYRAILEQQSDLICRFRADGTLTFVNDAYCRGKGRSREALLGTSVWDVIPPAAHQAVWRRLETAAATRAAVTTEHATRGPDGAPCWQQWTSSAIFDEEGRLVEYQSHGRDITERKRAEDARAQLEAERLAGAALHESRERLQAALHASGTGTFRWDIRTDTIHADESLDRLLGLPPGKSVRSLADFLAVLHPDDVEKTVAGCQQCSSEGGEFTKEFRVVWPDGSVHSIVDTGKTFVDEAGKPLYATGAFADVTARRREAQELRALAESLPTFVWFAAADGAIDFLSSKWYAFTGASEKDALGFGWAALVHPDDREKLAAAWARAERAGAPFEDDHRLRAAGGEYEWFLSRALPMRDDAGRVVRWFGTCTNINEQKRVEERERAARGAAEAANRTKDEFLAVLSHELRTPLTSMLVWIGLLKDPGLDRDARRRAIATIERAARAQNQLVSDILDVSRIVAGKFQLDLHPIDDPPAIVRSALQALAPLAEKSGVACDVDIDPCAGPIRGDALRLEQVVANLVTNAIKFTPSGGRIAVRCALEGGALVLRVADTGRGIDAAFLPYVFERFRQEDASPTRARGGLGLGLAIVRHIVELHGGTVSAESPGLGEGATFTVRLPLSSGEARARPVGPAPADGAPLAAEDARAPLEGVRVLVVEDDPDTREGIARILAQCGASVALAADARTALRALEGDAPPDVLLCDIGLPGEDGHALLRRAREDGRTVPAAALTAFASVDDQVRSLAAGFQLHLAKPVDPTEIVRAVTFLAKGKGPAALAADSGEQPPRGAGDVPLAGAALPR
jgi:PAS domain S-box-containing protein